ncbi:TetR/AcrR family transcriptional regulator [Actinoplanes sp. NPDC051475]|uniref:TetR/AcrR family transcriptional regulator n=1 Tax=Actinoplanes sp. NPDC051475 TaxID=3157225 RepID=UPI0034506A89
MAAAAPGGSATSAGRTRRRRGIVEQEIYEHAARLFAERGFAATSLQDIAVSMGLTRTAIYHYVDSKDALLEQIVTEVTLEGVALLRGIRGRTDLDPLGRLRLAAYETASRNAENPARFRLWHIGQMELSEPLASRNERAKREVLAELRGLIDDGVRAGVLRPVDSRTAALGILGMCNWIAWWFRPSPEHPVEPVAEAFAEMAVQGLVAAPAGTSGPAGPSPQAASALAAVREQLDRLDAALQHPPHA